MIQNSATGGESALKAGTLVANRYRIERLVGRGGTALVYAARDTRREGAGEATGLDVAVKVLRSDLVNTISRDRFVREVELVLTLSHPNVLPVLDAGFDGDIVYCVMPLVRGRTLAARLGRERQLTVAEAARIVARVAGALGAAHTMGIVHRDVKPENILLEDEQVWLADFGIARAIMSAGGERLTLSGIAVGTPMYMSPEQAGGTAVLDGRSDQYSLACVAYETLAGVPPFRGATPQVVAQQRLVAPPQDIRQLRPELSDAVAEVLMKALRATPAERYETVVGFAEALGGAAEQGARVTPFQQVPVPGSRRRAWSAVMLSGVALAGVGWWAASRGASRRPLDADLFAVAPVEVEASAASIVTSEVADRLLGESLARWTGAKVVRLADGSAVRGSPLSSEQQRRRARDLGAAHVLRAAVFRVGDKAHVRLVLSDIGAQAERSDVTRSVAPTAVAIGMGIDSMTDLLMQVALAPDLRARSGAPPSRSTAAMRAYGAGHASLTAWRLDSAALAFARARIADRTFALAALWQAQALAWRAPFRGAETGSDSAQLVEAARFAVAAGLALDARERALAAGMLALAERHFSDACRYFDPLVRVDSADLSSLLGAGECRRRDRTVVPDARGRGPQFQASYHASIRAFVRAMRLVPQLPPGLAAAALTRLPVVLMSEPTAIRMGRDAAGEMYAAYPALVADTFAFTPVPMIAFTMGEGGAPALQIEAARRRANDLLRGIAAAWAGALPDQPDVHELYALALENAALFTDQSGGASVEREVSTVERVSRDSAQLLRVALTRLRVGIKRGEWSQAAHVGDSLLASHAAATGEAAVRLAPVAALLGRATPLRLLLPRSASEAVRGLTEGERDAFYGAEAALALGESAADVVSAMALVRDRVRDPALTASLCVMAMSAYPVVGATPLHVAPACAGVPLVSAQAALEAGDTVKVRRTLDDAARRRSGVLNPTLSADAALGEASLRWALGDSATARARVTATLAHLDAQGTAMLSEVFLAASLARLLELDVRWAANGRSSGSAVAIRALRGTRAPDRSQP